MNVETTLAFTFNVTRTDSDQVVAVIVVFCFSLSFVTFVTFQDTINHLKAQNTELQEMLANSENPDSMEPSGTESRFLINTFVFLK